MKALERAKLALRNRLKEKREVALITLKQRRGNSSGDVFEQLGVFGLRMKSVRKMTEEELKENWGSIDFKIVTMESPKYREETE